MSAVCGGLVLCVAHAVLRPVSVRSAFGGLVSELRGAKTREEVAKTVKKSVKGFSNMFKKWAKEEPEQMRVFVNVKGEPPAGAGGMGGAAAPPGQRGGGGVPPRPPPEQLPPPSR